MNYQETTEYLYNQLPVYQKIGSSAYKEGLDNSLALDTLFDHPHRRYKTIHVAGTNGKGSTSHTLAAILQESGYKVGLYTSPHLVDFRERIRVNGDKITEQYVIDFVAQYITRNVGIHPSFFELTMMMAFCYFADCQVDVAIIEVGLGGRLDSTNIISPNLCVITNIGLDHVQFLGNTVEKIAVEKAGIIKQNIPVVIGEARDGVRHVFEHTAQNVGAPIIFAEDRQPIISYKQTPKGWELETKNYSTILDELGGYAQLKNAATILCAIDELKTLGYTIPTNAVQDGFMHVCELTGLMGRWQIIQDKNPKIVCDTGHNAAGIKYIAQQLADEKYDTLHIVLGMVSDKDVSSVLSLLPPHAVYYFTKASVPRAINEAELQNLAKKFNLNGRTYPSVEEAVVVALDNTSRQGLIFIGGSNFVVADALTSKALNMIK